MDNNGQLWTTIRTEDSAVLHASLMPFFSFRIYAVDKIFTGPPVPMVTPNLNSDGQTSSDLCHGNYLTVFNNHILCSSRDHVNSPNLHPPFLKPSSDLLTNCTLRLRNLSSLHCWPSVHLGRRHIWCADIWLLKLQIGGVAAQENT